MSRRYCQINHHHHHSERNLYTNQ